MLWRYVVLLAVKALVRFIRENLADPQLKFHLCESRCVAIATVRIDCVPSCYCSDTTPPKQVLKRGRMTFAEVGYFLCFFLITH